MSEIRAGSGFLRPPRPKHPSERQPFIGCIGLETALGRALYGAPDRGNHPVLASALSGTCPKP